MRKSPELVWEVYLSLEEEFINYIRNVPLVSNHNNVWSHPLASILNNVGSCVDSFFKNAIDCQSLDGKNNILTLRKKRKINMNDYRSFFDFEYGLSSKTIFNLQNYTSHCPFDKWGTNQTPPWWKNYTDIKHDRFRNKEQATLILTLEALGGLFLLFITHKETMDVLIDRDVIKGFGFPKDNLKGMLTYGKVCEKNVGNCILAKTELFGYVFEDDDWKCDDNEKRRILSPGYQGY